jgi:lysophospholipase L1-like esterase
VRHVFRPFRLWTAAALAAVAITSFSGPVQAEGPAALAKSPPCSGPTDLVRLGNALPRLAKKLAAGDPITIVAIGSSSTAGAGASSPAASYPSRLAVELGTLFPDTPIRVVNRGVNGEEAPQMIARFDSEVISEKPDLVLWQVGTNALLRDHPLAPAGLLIRDGVRMLKEAGADVVLVDPQFAPKVIAKANIDTLVDMIAAAGKEANVGVFHRFAVMRHWREAQNIGFETFVSPDELHMNDWSYGCIAKLLAGAIQEASTRATVTATVHGRQ